MRICPHCGMSNSDINKWCESCGFELIVEDREAVNTPKSSATVMNDTRTAGFVGSMGKTHYVSGHTSEDAGDMQKHVSGFGLIGSVGSVMYDAEVEHDNPSESCDVNGSLLGSVGKTKYSLSDASAVKDYEHRDSKLYGRVGTVQYRDARTASSTAHGINTTSGLMGSVGDSIYMTEYGEDSNVSEEREIDTAGLVGNIGGIHYRAASKDTDRTNESRKIVKSRKPIVVAGIAVALVVIVVLAIIVIKPASQDYSAAISRRIENEIVSIPDPPLEYEYSNAILRAISYKVVSQNKSANTAIVQFKYVDVMAMADTLGNRAIDRNDYYNYCIEAIKSGTAPYATNTITVAFEMREINGVNQLCVIDSFDLADILSGGTVSAYLRIMEGLS